MAPTGKTERFPRIRGATNTNTHPRVRRARTTSSRTAPTARKAAMGRPRTSRATDRARGIGPRRGDGVTLLELLIVLMIIAIVTAVVIPILGAGGSNVELR